MPKCKWLISLDEWGIACLIKRTLLEYEQWFFIYFYFFKWKRHLEPAIPLLATWGHGDRIVLSEDSRLPLTPSLLSKRERWPQLNLSSFLVLSSDFLFLFFFYFSFFCLDSHLLSSLNILKCAKFFKVWTHIPWGRVSALHAEPVPPVPMWCLSFFT